MNRRKQIYEGKAKILFEGPDDFTLIQYFKDDATAFNNQKHDVLLGKGVVNGRISALIMGRLNETGIPTHFIKAISAREQLVRKVQIIPLEVVIRNIVAGSLAKRLGLKEGEPLIRPLIELYFKDDQLGDPLVSEEHVLTFEWADLFELEEMKMYALRINDFLSGMFLAAGIKLIDFKLEFGRVQDGDINRLVLADEISPDGCRLWDIATNEKMDKDRFRQDLGDVMGYYREVARRLGLNIDEDEKETAEVVELNQKRKD